MFNPETVLRQDTLLLYNPCKDQTYSHNLHFKITELARRVNPETVLRRIYYCYIILWTVEEKEFVLSSSLRIPDPSLLGDP